MKTITNKYFKHQILLIFFFVSSKQNKRGKNNPYFSVSQCLVASSSRNMTSYKFDDISEIY